jgi:putative ABC transport system permease protein
VGRSQQVLCLLQVLIEGRWILIASMFALVGAAIGGLYPALQAARKDPMDALAYE